MAQAIVLPKLGNTAESAIILAWHANVGDEVSAGDVLCEIETDKATLEVESSAGGVLLARLFEAGDDVPVLSQIAVVGRAGESVEEFQILPSPEPPHLETRRKAIRGKAVDSPIRISPRARNLAERKGIEYADLTGSGPGGRLIERDINAAIKEGVKITPVAQAMLDSGDFQLADPQPRSARVGKLDLVPADSGDEIEEIPLRGVRQTIARRLLASTQTTAQLTLNSSADARALRAFRERLKESDEALGLRAININDLLMFAVARTLPAFPNLNALFENDTIYQFSAAHLGMAVDTERGLLVPVIRKAQALSLKQLSAEARRLAAACRDGSVSPDELAGGTFTVSNLGALGIENFTPLLNPPQVAILGIGSIHLKPVAAGDGVEFRPHIGLSLTIDHQVVDGAPAVRFLAQLARHLAQIDLLAAI
ncbi:MAG: dihydrolipoamide acetyltransferase family protein [Chloroflexi bacterium]|nr:dihydrolipoamide acetyltransferase family protein [Chloroflexota bacterium]